MMNLEINLDLRDALNKTMGRINITRDVGIDLYDAEENAVRLAEQTVRELFRKVRGNQT